MDISSLFFGAIVMMVSARLGYASVPKDPKTNARRHASAMVCWLYVVFGLSGLWLLNSNLGISVSSWMVSCGLGLASFIGFSLATGFSRLGDQPKPVVVKRRWFQPRQQPTVEPTLYYTRLHEMGMGE